MVIEKGCGSFWGILIFGNWSNPKDTQALRSKMNTWIGTEHYVVATQHHWIPQIKIWTSSRVATTLPALVVLCDKPNKVQLKTNLSSTFHPEKPTWMACQCQSILGCFDRTLEFVLDLFFAESHRIQVLLRCHGIHGRSEAVRHKLRLLSIWNCLDTLSELTVLIQQSWFCHLKGIWQDLTGFAMLKSLTHEKLPSQKKPPKTAWICLDLDPRLRFFSELMTYPA